MPLWTMADGAAGVPRILAEGGAPNKTAQTMYQNTTSGAFVSGAIMGAHAVDTTEKGIATGKILRVSVKTGGTGYTNGDLVRVVGLTTNGSANLTTNSTGGITSSAVVTAGAGINPVTARAYAFTNSTGGTTAGTGGEVVIGLDEGKYVAHSGWVLRREGTGGRAGRVNIETLVASGSISSDGSDDTIFPDS